MSAATFAIKLPLFEGPFDLLLFFIERDELDIYDIPIATITNDFLAYMRQLEQANIEQASEFILVAATLMRIKAKMLLPRPELNEKGEMIDPRAELISHLLEYKRYKNVVKDLATLEHERQAQFERGYSPTELKDIAEKISTELEIENIDLYKLLRVYVKVMQRYENEKNRPVHTVVPFPYTVEEQKIQLKQLLQTHRRLSFAELISNYRNKALMICNFLAILELLHLGEMNIEIHEGFNNFVIF